MNSCFLLSRRLRWINLPGAILMALLQRTPILTAIAATDEMVIASPVGAVLKALAVAAASLGAMNSLAGATPLVPSTGTATGITVDAGTAVSVFYTVNGTQTPPMSWTVTGNIPPGLNFSGLTSSGSVDVGLLRLQGTPTTAGTYNLTIQTFQFTGTAGVGSPVYPYTIVVNGSSTTSAPAFTTQPASQTVTAGNSVTFTAAASGSPAPTYQWRKDNATIAGATSASLTIASVATGDAGTYTVVATNTAGSATSTGAVLTVNAATSAPAFTTQPASQTVAAGTSVTFTAAASGSPAPTYQWRKDNATIAGATSASFTIAGVAAGDAGTYTVVATNTAGSATSNGAVLTVTAATSAPAFTTQPASQTVDPGASVTFTAAASGSPTPTYQWRKDNATIAGATSASLTIANAATGDAGTYTVVATNTAGSATSNGAVLTVNAATSAPAFTTQPASQTVDPGAPVTFTAAASGSPTPTYQWMKDNAMIAGATTASFMIVGVAAGDAGTYTVVATNTAGSATSTGAVLTVNPPPGPSAPTITAQPHAQTMTAGQGATFTVAATGNPAPTGQWQRLPAGSATWETLNEGGSYHGVASATLSVDAVTAAMSGDQFRVVLTNASGAVTSSAAALTVSGTASALLQYPTDVAPDGSGNLYATDASSDTIRKIAPDGTITTFAGSAGIVGSADGTGTAAQFNQPGGVVVDGSGNVYVADTGNATLRKITPAGIVTTLAGSPATRGSTDGTGSGATFNQPGGIALDSTGNFYVADAFNDTIRKISPAGVVTTLAGTPGSRGDADGTGAAALFNFPDSVTVDAVGNVYVADTFNDTIRKITPAGVVTTLAGSAGISGSNDGTGANALFNQPYGVAVDATGNVYVADTANATIRRITPAGAVTTLAGVAGVAGMGNGAGTSALFNQPRGLVVDPAGNVFVADTGNGAIRKVAPDGTVSTLALSAPPPPPPPPPPPGNTPPPPSMGGSGGGGGAMSTWFMIALALLAAARQAGRRREARARAGR